MEIGTLGWLGNIGIIGGIYGLGNRWRNAFILSMLGESAYIVRALLTSDWSLLGLCVVLFVLALRGYLKWGSDEVRAD